MLKLTYFPVVTRAATSHGGEAGIPLRPIAHLDKFWEKFGLKTALE